MKSLAIYYKCQDNGINDIPPFELHINIWKVEEGRLYLHPAFYIDFGIKLPCVVSEIKIFLPFKCEEPKDNDLGNLLGDRKLLSTVFNDDFIPVQMENSCYVKVNKGTKTEFYLYKLGSNNLTYQGHHEDGYDGDIIHLKDFRTLNISQDADTGSEDYYRYVRFRLKAKDISEIVKSQHISNDMLQAAFSKIDLFDIRINELREIHDKVQECAVEDHFKLCEFTKIHLFYMVDTKESVQNGSSLKVDSRMLEDSQWSKYEPTSDLKGVTYIAHHWKSKQKDDQNLVKSFTLFFSTIYPSLDIARLLAYFIMILFTSSFASFLISDIESLFGEKYDSFNKKIILLGCMFGYLLIYLFITNFKFKIGSIHRKR